MIFVLKLPFPTFKGTPLHYYVKNCNGALVPSRFFLLFYLTCVWEMTLELMADSSSIGFLNWDKERALHVEKADEQCSFSQICDHSIILAWDPLGKQSQDSQDQYWGTRENKTGTRESCYKDMLFSWSPLWAENCLDPLGGYTECISDREHLFTGSWPHWQGLPNGAFMPSFAWVTHV